MLTKVTQTAISILRIISSENTETESGGKKDEQIIDKLELAGIIRKKEGMPKYQIYSYELARDRNEISLLDILEATGEHLNCNHPTTEEFYERFGKTAQKLGVVNHMTRLYLKAIKLTEL